MSETSEVPVAPVEGEVPEEPMTVEALTAEFPVGDGPETSGDLLVTLQVRVAGMLSPEQAVQEAIYLLGAHGMSHYVWVVQDINTEDVWAVKDEERLTQEELEVELKVQGDGSSAD